MKGRKSFSFSAIIALVFRLLLSISQNASVIVLIKSIQIIKLTQKLWQPHRFVCNTFAYLIVNGIIFSNKHLYFQCFTTESPNLGGDLETNLQMANVSQRKTYRH